MRYPLLPDEEPSPLERVLVIADSGNGASWELDINRWHFINPELTVHVVAPEARPLSDRLGDAEPAPLLAHLARVREAPIAVVAPRDPTVRLQSGPAEPTAPARRRSFLGKLRDLFGS